MNDAEKMPAVGAALCYGYIVAVAAAWWWLAKLFILYVIAELLGGK